MFYLHQALVGLVTDLVKLVSPTTLPLKLIVTYMSSVSDYSSPASASPPSKISGALKAEAGTTPETSSKVFTDTRMDEEVTKQRMEQQQCIQQLVSYIDERAAH